MSFRMFAALILSYLIGSFPTAYLTGRILRKIDIRQHGSGNVGATNVFRVIGKRWGMAVLGIDMLKGAIAALGIPAFLGIQAFTQELACGLLAIAGHTWTPWLKFKGGKGVATSAGVFFTLAPKSALPAFMIWIAVFIWKRYVSLASLTAALSFPLLTLLVYRNTDLFPSLFPISLCLMIFILYTHQANIRRLREGSEKRLA